MVFVKVRETYDLQTIKNKMTVIGIHTPKPDIIKRNYPGLLMQCRAYRPVSADVRIACASMLPLDPQGVGLAEGDVAPEDVFNPILYKAMSNKGMSQLEARVQLLARGASVAGSDVDGNTAAVDVDSLTGESNEFNIYYGLLSNTHDWKHANPQSGLTMSDLRPFVYERLYAIPDVNAGNQEIANAAQYAAPGADGNQVIDTVSSAVLGSAKPIPFINCTAYSRNSSATDGGIADPGFLFGDNAASNAEINVPWINCVVGCIIVPPSRLHQLFYRMVVEWTIEFSALRPFSEIVTWGGLSNIGNATHYQNYSYEATKEALTGTDETILDKDACMVSANVGVNKVM